MKRYYYDLHIHSCLSPCADNDNTPNNILGMASLAGLDILALTDHNSTKNCPAFFKAAEEYGIIPVAGMELTTSEDIHVVCLFPDLDSALAFDESLTDYKIHIKNRPEIFGDQLILDDKDELIGKEEDLLINATMISIEDVPEAVRAFGGISYPAHIDRESNGIISTLGTFPETPYFSAAEFHDASKIEAYREKYAIGNKVLITSSDAHHLEDIRDKEFSVELDCDQGDHTEIRKCLLSYIAGGGEA